MATCSARVAAKSLICRVWDRLVVGTAMAVVAARKREATVVNFIFAEYLSVLVE